MWTSVIVVAAALLALAWVPVGVHFWKSWRMRGAPLSLAICGLIGFQIYINASVWLFVQNDPRWVATVTSIGNLLTLANFYLCFRWQKKRFPNARKEPNGLKKRRGDSPPLL